MYLFEASIAGWADWGRCFQDRAAFTPLAMAILKKEGLLPLPLGSLTPGTSAVFRTGDRILKIFYPPESGRDGSGEWQTEAAVLRHIAGLGLCAPRLLAAGAIQDRYLFRYLLMSICPGTEAGTVLPQWKEGEKVLLARQVKLLLARLHHPADDLPLLQDLAGAALQSPKFDGLSPGLTQDFHALARQYAALGAGRPSFHTPVLVHGDCTGENLLVCKEREQMRLSLIDFADCRIAPAWYELPPVVFELFNGDPVLTRAYIGTEDPAVFLEGLLWGLALHAFGGEILKGFLRRKNLRFDAVPSLAALRSLLAAHFFGAAELPL